MDIEYEIKVLDVDTKKLRVKLGDLGFIQHEQQEFRRYIYAIESKNAWVRLRTNGKKTTLAYKQYIKDSIDGVKELEIDVSDFSKSHELMQLLGYKASAYQENRRSVFTLDDIEISIDEWPLIPAYAEIEAKDKATVEKYLDKIDLQSNRTTSKPTSHVYKLYGYDISSFEHLAFESENKIET